MNASPETITGRCWTLPQLSPSARFVVRVWLASRGALLLVVLVLLVTTDRTILQLLGNWDVEHFARIAVQGYRTPTDPAFFPGLPLLMAALNAIGITPIIGGVIVSTLASIPAAAALYRLGGERLGVAAASLWLIAPMTVFTFVGYTESLFCACAFWAWERARSRRWWQTSLLAAGACMFRVSGLFLIGALALLLLGQWITARRARARIDVRNLAALVPPALVLFGIAWFHRLRTGSWWTWFNAQATGWNRGFHWPSESLHNTFKACRRDSFPGHEQWALLFRLEVVAMAVGILITIVLLARLRVAEAAWVGIQCLAFSTSFWWISINRAVLLWFPLWLLLAAFAVEKFEADDYLWGREIGEKWSTLLNQTKFALVTSYVTVASLSAIVWAWTFFTGLWAS